jgi:hypothetical protein
MTPRRLDRPRAKPVTMAACRCGGAWLALDAVQALLGAGVKLDAFDGDTSRRCPHCTLTMTTVLLPGVVPVETCTACRGVWLDWPDVLALGDKGLEALLRPPPELRYAGLAAPDDEPRPLEGGSFTCAKCQQPRARAEAQGTSHGLVCAACAPQVQPIPRAPDVDLDLEDVDLADAVLGD